MAESPNRFSRRLGFGRQPVGPPTYHAAPERVRAGTISILAGVLQLRPSAIRGIICDVCRVRPEPGNWSEYPNIWDEAQRLVYSAEWYEFYDFVEACAAVVRSSGRSSEFETAINRLFEEENIGWRLRDGVLEMHADDALESVLETAESDLRESGFQVAAREFKEARADLSRRPEPDLSGAIHHAMAALESVAREVTGDPKRTLGEIIKRHPDLLPPPVDEAAARLWGFASDQARHAKESRELDWAEALLVVGVAGTLCSYLIAKKNNL